MRSWRGRRTWIVKNKLERPFLWEGGGGGGGGGGGTVGLGMWWPGILLTRCVFSREAR